MEEGDTERIIACGNNAPGNAADSYNPEGSALGRSRLEIKSPGQRPGLE
jgi:hypothetical protein